MQGFHPFGCLQVGPQAVFVVTRDEDDMSSAHTSDLEEEDEIDGDDAASWTTVDSAEQRGREVCSSKFHNLDALIRSCYFVNVKINETLD